MTEQPHTEAGRALLDRLIGARAGVPDLMRQEILAIEAQARPAVASEGPHPMTYCEPCSQCRQRLASDAGRSVGALAAVERDQQERFKWRANDRADEAKGLLREAEADRFIDSRIRTRIRAFLDAESKR